MIGSQMDPLFLVVAIGALVGAVLDRSEEAEARRKAILGPHRSFPHDDDRLLFDLGVQHYRETGISSGPEFTSWMYLQAKENRVPGEVVSKVMAAIRDAIRSDRLSRWEFRSLPRYQRHHWITTQADGKRVHLARLVYVDVLALHESEGRAGLNRYNEMRDYIERCSSVLVIDYNDKTHEFWAWIPTPDNASYATDLRRWNTISRKWPDFVDPEVAYATYPKRKKEM